MTNSPSPDRRSPAATPRARRSIGSAIFVLVMILACVIALLATTFYLTGTFITASLPTVAP